MGQVIIAGGSGGGVTSDEVTVTKDNVLSGYTYVGSDTDDEIGTGTLELTGNATAPFVVEGNTFYNTDAHTKIEGTAVNRETVDNTIGGINSNYPNVAIHKGDNLQIGTTTVSGESLFALRVPHGWYNDGAYVGTLTSNLGTATATQVLSGKTFSSSAGIKVAGKMTNVQAIDPAKSVSFSNGTYYVRMTNGAHITNASQGYPEVSITGTTFGNALAKHVLSGYTFSSSNGLKLSGTMTCNSILSFSAAASGKKVTFTWKNPVAATGKPYCGIFIAYSTSAYPGANPNASRAYTGYGSNKTSGATSTVTVTMPAYAKYYFSATAFVSFYDNGTWFTDLYGNTMNATATTWNPCDCDCCDNCDCDCDCDCDSSTVCCQGG